MTTQPSNDKPDDFSDDETFISKSQRKREMHYLQNLGEQLTKLKPAELKTISISETLLDAIHSCQAISKHEALRRQKQFIGKLMRAEDVEMIEQQLLLLESPQSSNPVKKQNHLVEQWYDKLIQADNALFTEFISEFPQINIQKLRQLIRNVQQELKQNKSDKQQKALKHFLTVAFSKACF